MRRKIELRCLAENIPNNIEVDLKGLDIGASVKISSVKLPDNTSPTITDRDFVVATIAPPTIVKEPEKTTEETAEGIEVKPLLQVRVKKLRQLMQKRVKPLRKRKKAKRPLVEIKNRLENLLEKKIN